MKSPQVLSKRRKDELVFRKGNSQRSINRHEEEKPCTRVLTRMILWINFCLEKAGIWKGGLWLNEWWRLCLPRFDYFVMQLVRKSNILELLPCSRDTSMWSSYWYSRRIGIFFNFLFFLISYMLMIKLKISSARSWIVEKHFIN